MRVLPLTLWLGLVLGALGYLSSAGSFRDLVETDLLAMLPQDNGKPWMRDAQESLGAHGTQKVVFLFGHKDKAKAIAAKVSFEKAMQAQGLLVPNQSVAQSVRALSAFLYPYRSGLLAEEDRARLLSGQAKVLFDRAVGQILSPFGFANAQLLQEDPYQLFPSYLAGIVKKTQFQSQEGTLYVKVQGVVYAVLEGELGGKPFDQDFQDIMVAAFEQAKAAAMARWPDLSVARLSSVFYAYEARRQAQQEVSWVGGLSTVGIILLTLLAFRRGQPLLISLLAIGSGLIAATAMAVLIFGKLHLIAFVFGAGLVGIAVDYAFHYSCAGLQGQGLDGWEKKRRIARPLTYSLISTLIGFSALLWSPIEGLKQISVMGIVGLSTSYFLVLFVFPPFDKKPISGPASGLLMRLSALHHLFWQGRQGQRRGVAILLVLFVLAGIGSRGFHFDDDVRALRNLSATLMQEEELIREVLGQGNGTQGLIVYGDDEASVLVQEKILLSQLADLELQGAFDGLQSIAQVLPTFVEQVENVVLVREELYGKYNLQLKALLGVTPAPLEPKILYPEAFWKSAGETLYKHLRIESPTGRIGHIILLDRVTEPAKIQVLANESKQVIYYDPATEISGVLGAFRQGLFPFAVLGLSLVAAFLVLRHGWRSALRILLPPLMAIILTPFLLPFISTGPFTFFHTIALVLVFAISLDYAFFCFAAEAQALDHAMMANGLSALSTILAFGLLGLSSFYAVHAIGVTVFVGMVLAYFLAPLAAYGHKPGGEA